MITRYFSKHPRKTEKRKSHFDSEPEIKRPVDEKLDDLTVIYFKEFSKVSFLSKEEELDLYEKAKKDPESKERFVKSYLRLVASIAGNYLNRGLTFLDLIQEGNIGLLKALGNFKPEEDCRFSTYSTWWIHQSIKRGLADKSRTIRIPSYLAGKIFKAKREMERIEKITGRNLSMREKMCYLVDQYGEDKVECLFAALKQIILPKVEIDRTNERKEISRKNEIEDKKVKKVLDSPELARIDIEELLKKLKPDSAEILRMRYGLNGYTPLSLDEIGQRATPQVTREAIRQKEKKAIRFLQELVKKNLN